LAADLDLVADAKAPHGGLGDGQVDLEGHQSTLSRRGSRGTLTGLRLDFLETVLPAARFAAALRAGRFAAALRARLLAAARATRFAGGPWGMGSPSTVARLPFTRSSPLR